MNKKNIFIVSALLIALVVVFSLFYPPANKSGSAGTVGKVDKYRNSKTGQDLVFFRNGFLQDTSVLKSVINLLAVNETVLGKLPKDFKSWETSLKPTIAKDKKLEIQFNKLNELGLFLSNNLTTIKSTRELLTKYYTKDTVDMKIDVQNNLLQFDGFINALNEKSKVIDTLFLNLDGMIDKDKIKKLTSTKDEAEKLKEIREKMLGSMVVYGITCGVQTTLNTALNSTVLSFTAFNNQLNTYTPFSWTYNAQINQRIPFSNKLGSISEYINQQVVSGFVHNKASLSLKDMAVSNIVNCKELGIIVVGNQYVFGATNNQSTIECTPLESYINGAKALNRTTLAN